MKRKTLQIMNNDSAYLCKNFDLFYSDFSMFISRTLEERAQRLFSTKGLQMEDLDPSMFAKSKPGKTGKNK